MIERFRSVLRLRNRPRHAPIGHGLCFFFFNIVIGIFVALCEPRSDNYAPAMLSLTYSLLNSYKSALLRLRVLPGAADPFQYPPYMYSHVYTPSRASGALHYTNRVILFHHHRRLYLTARRRRRLDNRLHGRGRIANFRVRTDFFPLTAAG